MSKMLRMTEEEFAKRTTAKQKEVSLKAPIKQNKFRNTKTVVGGIKFDSKKEAKRWKELKLLEASGEIHGLKLQTWWTLIPAQTRDDGTKERKVEYVADFDYYTDEGRVIEDCKGMKTPAYIIKRKLMLQVHGITIKEV